MNDYSPATTQKKLTLSIAICLGIALNVWFIIQRRQPQVPVNDPRQAKRMQREQYGKWLSNNAIPITIDTVRNIVVKIADRGCMPIPDGTEEFGIEDISATQQDDLNSAVEGLLAMFAGYSASSLVSYMENRGEVLDGQMVAFMKQNLIEESGFAASDLRVMTEKEVLELFWKTSKVQAGWNELLPDASCLRLWSVSKVNRLSEHELQVSLGRPERETWQTHGRHRHIFVGENSIDDVLKTDGTLVFADFKAVIRHGGERTSGISPYYFRFWYDSIRAKWRPYDMVRVSTFAQAPRRILF